MKAVLFAVALLAQTFDTASIKPSGRNANGSTYDYQPGGGLRVRSGTLQGLIESAYDVRDFQVAGGPSWLNTDQFDILARSESAAAGLSRADDVKATRIRLQALLADRFHLVVHRETRELQEYALSVDKGGPRMAALRSTATSNPRGGIQQTCGQLIGTQASLSQVVFALSRQMRRPVVDRTGLTGRYDFLLNWTPELAPCADATDNAPSIFTALQEQLGLRLDSIKGPVDTIVVDRAERPSAN
jgi:uncharacterized protein (TIGR03435 family)